MDDDYEDSSLSELSSEEEEYVGPSKGKKNAASSRAKKEKDFKLTGVLKPYRVVQFAARSLYDKICAGDVDLNPDYQRDVVWTDSKQIQLIDSILRNYYIPPIIFAVQQDDTGAETRTCIDGKQRLTSIQKFMDGLPAKKQLLLPKELRKRFEDKQVACVEYTDLGETNEREIFQRVQLGVALTVSEKLQALSSPWVNMVRDVVSRYVQPENMLGGAIDFDNSRSKDFHCVAQLLYYLDKADSGELFTTSKKTPATVPTAVALMKLLTKKSPPEPPASFIQRVTTAMDIFTALTKHDEYSPPFRRPSRISPVEFVMIAVMISRHMKKLSAKELSNAVAQMRETGRKEHSDMRMNTKVIKTLLGVIQKVGTSTAKPASTANGSKGKQKEKEKEEVPAAEDERFLETVRSLYKTRGTKRKLAPDSDVDMEDAESVDEPLKERAKKKATLPAFKKTKTPTTSPSDTPVRRFTPLTADPTSKTAPTERIETPSNPAATSPATSTATPAASASTVTTSVAPVAKPFSLPAFKRLPKPATLRTSPPPPSPTVPRTTQTTAFSQISTMAAHQAADSSSYTQGIAIQQQQHLLEQQRQLQQQHSPPISRAQISPVTTSHPPASIPPSQPPPPGPPILTGPNGSFTTSPTQAYPPPHPSAQPAVTTPIKQEPSSAGWGPSPPKSPPASAGWGTAETQIWGDTSSAANQPSSSAWQIPSDRGGHSSDRGRGRDWDRDMDRDRDWSRDRAQGQDGGSRRYSGSSQDSKKRGSRFGGAVDNWKTGPVDNGWPRGGRGKGGSSRR
ncbi:hypothetical protein SISNIDRAFT_468310 [Sistotremastrum niveocremeum HHB9708]|uniref:GmrSD restriction endonucleases N-terminal domain-containing protein n=1 Tax=Sistotremastrum niveocremeum HHB9708 TaxID=1314777 RepID=A0A164RR94_9AGAM|nr:hypothetical protein SISNIDRAFT_468310 [Sistotremastrum niveocremeum HHB9708]